MEHYDFKYLLKVDTDTFVNMPKFIDYIIDKGGDKRGFYAGAQGLAFYLFLSSLLNGIVN